MSALSSMSKLSHQHNICGNSELCEYLNYPITGELLDLWNGIGHKEIICQKYRQILCKRANVSLEEALKKFPPNPKWNIAFPNNLYIYINENEYMLSKLDNDKYHTYYLAQLVDNIKIELYYSNSLWYLLSNINNISSYTIQYHNDNPFHQKWICNINNFTIEITE